MFGYILSNSFNICTASTSQPIATSVTSGPMTSPATLNSDPFFCGGQKNLEEGTETQTKANFPTMTSVKFGWKQSHVTYAHSFFEICFASLSSFEEFKELNFRDHDIHSRDSGLFNISLHHNEMCLFKMYDACSFNQNKTWLN